MHIWRLPPCYEVYGGIEPTLCYWINTVTTDWGLIPLKNRWSGCIPDSVLFMHMCQRVHCESGWAAVTVRLWCRCCVQHLCFFFCLCLTFLYVRVLAEQRRHLCKCLPYENLGKTWLESNKLKTSGQRRNICCLEGDGWSEQGHRGKSEGKWREKVRRKQCGKIADSFKNWAITICW